MADEKIVFKTDIDISEYVNNLKKMESATKALSSSVQRHLNTINVNSILNEDSISKLKQQEHSFRKDYVKRWGFKTLPEMETDFGKKALRNLRFGVRHSKSFDVSDLKRFQSEYNSALRFESKIARMNETYEAKAEGITSVSNAKTEAQKASLEIKEAGLELKKAFEQLRRDISSSKLKEGYDKLELKKQVNYEKESQYERISHRRKDRLKSEFNIKEEQAFEHDRLARSRRMVNQWHKRNEWFHDQQQRTYLKKVLGIKSGSGLSKGLAGLGLGLGGLGKFALPGKVGLIAGGLISAGKMIHSYSSKKDESALDYMNSLRDMSVMSGISMSTLNKYILMGEAFGGKGTGKAIASNISNISQGLEDIRMGEGDAMIKAANLYGIDLFDSQGNLVSEDELLNRISTRGKYFNATRRAGMYRRFGIGAELAKQIDSSDDARNKILEYVSEYGFDITSDDISWKNRRNIINAGTNASKIRADLDIAKNLEDVMNVGEEIKKIKNDAERKSVDFIINPTKNSFPEEKNGRVDDAIRSLFSGVKIENININSTSANLEGITKEMFANTVSKVASELSMGTEVA